MSNMKLLPPTVLLLAAICGCATAKPKPKTITGNMVLDTVNVSSVSRPVFEGKISELRKSVADHITAKKESDSLFAAIDSVHYKYIRRSKAKRTSEKVAFWGCTLGGTMAWILSTPSSEGNDGMATGLWLQATPIVVATSMAVGLLISKTATGPRVTRQEAEELNRIINNRNSLLPQDRSQRDGNY